VEFIKIRDVSCSNCTAFFYQTHSNYVVHHFFLSSTEYQCDFVVQPGAEMTCSLGDYFGFYNCKDEQHTCSSSPNATTQTWFGG
jgi:hypothetical protein